MVVSITMLIRPFPLRDPFVRFTLIALGIYLLWFFGYERYLALDGRLDKVLTESIASNAATVLRLLGFDAAVSSTRLNLILLSNQPTVFIAPYCDGMVLYALFSGFIIAFPSSSLHKMWFIPLGIVLIYSVNVLRIVALCLNHYYSHQTVDFNHHYTFTFIVYGFICLLWLWWATRLAAPFPNSSPSHARL